MRVLIACDKFKGSMGAMEASEAMARGLGAGVEVVHCPIADGGEGFVATMVSAGGGRMISAPTQDPLGREVVAEYGLLPDGSAVLEMAAASGIWRLTAEERQPRRTSTFGTGLLMRHALEVSGAQRLLIGIGGSATNDGGAGMAAALGVKFLDAEGRELEPIPEALVRVAEVRESSRIQLPEILVACDVDHPLLGERGASAVFGPQKGAGPEDVRFLEQVLGRLVEVTSGQAQAVVPGAGAAGGLGFGMMRFAGARLLPGFDLVAAALKLETKIAQADVVITGEGSLDSQTLGGKGPAGVAAMARAQGKPVVGVAGRITEEAAGLLDAAFDLAAYGLPLEESMRRGPELLERRVAEVKDLIVCLKRG